MRTTWYACVTVSALFLVGTIVSLVVSFDRIENTTTVLAGVATAFAFLGYAIRPPDRSRG